MMLAKEKQVSSRVVRIENSHLFEHLKIYLDQGKKIKFTVSGNSMYPFIKNGDQVILKPIESTDIKQGRIVLACANGQFLLHRIVGFSASGVILAGDGNLMQHETVELKWIWAVVIEVVDRNGNRNVQSFFSVFLARVWYRIRLVRLLLFKVGLY